MLITDIDQPPKRELKVSDLAVRDLSLYDLHLAPSSVLHLKFLDDSLNHVNIPAPLAPEVLALSEDLPVPPVAEETAPGPSSSASKVSSASAQVASGEKKIPKWLKLGSEYSAILKHPKPNSLPLFYREVIQRSIDFIWMPMYNVYTRRTLQELIYRECWINIFCPCSQSTYDILHNDIRLVSYTSQGVCCNL